jgi:hypothetical protein
MEPAELYDQVWAKYQESVGSRIPGHVQRHMEKFSERQAKEPYSLPGEAAQLRQDFRRFVAREMLPLARLLEQHRQMWAQSAKKQGSRRKGRTRDPKTRDRARELLVFVASVISLDGALKNGSLKPGRGFEELVEIDKNHLEWRRLQALPWPMLREKWNAKYPVWWVASPSALKVEFYAAARDPQLSAEARARIRRNVEEEDRARHKEFSDRLAALKKASVLFAERLMAPAKAGALLVERLTALQKAGVLPPNEYLEQLPGHYGLFRATREWRAAGRPTRPPTPPAVPPSEAPV